MQTGEEAKGDGGGGGGFFVVVALDGHKVKNTQRRGNVRTEVEEIYVGLYISAKVSRNIYTNGKLRGLAQTLQAGEVPKTTSINTV